MDGENIVLFTIEIPDDEKRHHSHKISILTVDDSFFQELEDGSMQFDSASLPSLQASSSSLPTLATTSLLVDKGPIRPHRKASIVQDIFSQVFSQEHNDKFFTSCRSQQSSRWFTASHDSIDKSISDSIIRTRSDVQEIFDQVFSTGSRGPDITVVDISKLGHHSLPCPQLSKLDRQLWSSFGSGKEHNNAIALLSDQKRPPHHPKRKPTLTDSIVVLIDHKDHERDMGQYQQGQGSGISSCDSFVKGSIPAVISPGDSKNIPALSPLTIKSSRGGSIITPGDTKNVPVLSSLVIKSSRGGSLPPPVAFSFDQRFQGQSNSTSFIALPWFDTPSISSMSSFLSVGNIVDDNDEKGDTGDGDGELFLGSHVDEVNSGSDKAKSNDESVNPIKVTVHAPRESSILHSLCSKEEHCVANDGCVWDAAAGVGKNESINNAPVPAPVPLRTSLPTTLRVAIDGRDKLLLPPRRKPSILDWRSIEFFSSLPSLPEEEQAAAHDDNEEEQEGYCVEPDLLLSTKEHAPRKVTHDIPVRKR